MDKYPRCAHCVSKQLFSPWQLGEWRIKILQRQMGFQERASFYVCVYQLISLSAGFGCWKGLRRWFLVHRQKHKQDMDREI